MNDKYEKLIRKRPTSVRIVLVLVKANELSTDINFLIFKRLIEFIQYEPQNQHHFSESILSMFIASDLILFLEENVILNVMSENS